MSNESNSFQLMKKDTSRKPRLSKHFRCRFCSAEIKHVPRMRRHLKEKHEGAKVDWEQDLVGGDAEREIIQTNLCSLFPCLQLNGTIDVLKYAG